MSNALLRTAERKPPPKIAKWSRIRSALWLLLMVAMGAWVVMIVTT